MEISMLRGLHTATQVPTQVHCWSATVQDKLVCQTFFSCNRWYQMLFFLAEDCVLKCCNSKILDFFSRETLFQLIGLVLWFIPKVIKILLLRFLCCSLIFFYDFFLLWAWLSKLLWALSICDKFVDYLMAELGCTYDLWRLFNRPNLSTRNPFLSSLHVYVTL